MPMVGTRRLVTEVKRSQEVKRSNIECAETKPLHSARLAPKRHRRLQCRILDVTNVTTPTLKQEKGERRGRMEAI